MVEITVASIAALSSIIVAYIVNRNRKVDRNLAEETLDAKNAEIQGLKARLRDCQDDRRWLRTQVANEHPQ